jgi:hypothetical protein
VAEPQTELICLLFDCAYGTCVPDWCDPYGCGGCCKCMGGCIETMSLQQDDVPIYKQLLSEVCFHGRIATIGCYECCEVCNHDEHRGCHFCGAPSRHDGTEYITGLRHPCYDDADEDERLREELDRVGSSNA